MFETTVEPATLAFLRQPMIAHHGNILVCASGRAFPLSAQRYELSFGRMDAGARKGIVIPEATLSLLSTLCAGHASRSARALRRVLKFGHIEPASSAGASGDVGFLLSDTDQGWSLVAVAPSDVTAAWLRPFSHAEVKQRLRRGSPTDKRGSAEQDPRRSWFSENGLVNIYNAEVTGLGDITQQW